MNAGPPRRRACRALLFPLLLLPVFAPAAPAAERAWYVGADAVFSTVEAARTPGGFALDQTAQGAGVRAGRALGADWRLQANVSVADHRTVQPQATLRLLRASLEAVHAFRAGRPFRPWLLAGAGWFHAGAHAGDLPCDAEGPGLVAAGGWDLQLHGRLWLRGAARAEAVRWSGGPSLPAPLFDRWRASSQVVAGLTITL